MTFLAAGQMLFAALPPLAQGIREMESILSSEELHRLLSSAEIIQTITRFDGGYLVVTDKRFIEVRVEYLESEDGLAGPVRYHLEFFPSSSN